MTNAEIYRLIMNLIRFGIVEQVNLALDPPKARVRCGELLTDWLPWSVRRAGTAKTWWPPTEGEQVIILAAGGELSAGVIIASLYQNSAATPINTANTQHTTYPDGAVIEYNADTGALKATGIKTAVLDASESIQATAPEITCTASVKITLDTPTVECTNDLKTATLNVTGGGKMSGNIQHSGGTFSSNGVAVDSHTHSGVQRGGSNSDGPNK
ncbi:phage baseplate assembly protein V [Yersinia enterocolitica]|uniref:phage baseplate assembly protein V n=1 Tax=Yersinia enterocolitica TaxID=630 RepID=UPI00285CF61F|nr:phage baseplate assembly protein V [Yersinia enterocolitica]EKN4141930.1 phage baseplate assembly protein V [Yersinia enterocolitica]HDL6727313.1 phage baseplate assembly protein V [Yersinia enterocolitica]HDL7330491.1 phage baseplate assembly protein V [Yersinia enterocolitica]HDL7463954.1 phage baseplate assembly protein V [Yersinia enterocolitica]